MNTKLLAGWKRLAEMGYSDQAPRNPRTENMIATRKALKLAIVEVERLEEMRERISDYHNLVCPGDSTEQTLHDIEEIMESDDPANWVQGESEKEE